MINNLQIDELGDFTGKGGYRLVEAPSFERPSLIQRGVQAALSWITMRVSFLAWIDEAISYSTYGFTAEERRIFDGDLNWLVEWERSQISHDVTRSFCL